MAGEEGGEMGSEEKEKEVADEIRSTSIGLRHCAGGTNGAEGTDDGGEGVRERAGETREGMEDGAGEASGEHGVRREGTEARERRGEGATQRGGLTGRLGEGTVGGDWFGANSPSHAVIICCHAEA